MTTFRGNRARALHAAAAVAVLFLGARPAWANGRFPASNQIVFSPSDPNLIVARTTFGILPSHDNGATWDYLCEDALGLPQTAYQDPELGLTANNALVGGLYSPVAGLDVSTDLGCNWSCVGGPLANQSIADLVVRPDTPDVVLAVTSTYLPADAGGGTHSQVFESVDDGAHWAQLGASLDPGLVVQTIDVAKGAPQDIYLSGTRGFGSSRTASLFVSTDSGAHWTERPLPLFDSSTEDSIYIGAVDPTDPNRVYLRSSALITGGQSRLFVTTNSGQSFQAIQQFQVPDPGNLATSNEILGFALSPDGSKIYAGTKEDGLFVAMKSDLTFRKTSSIHVQCLATRGPELWACSDAVSGFVLGVSADDGATFSAKMATITSLAAPIACGASAGGPLACGAAANGSQCGAAFTLFCQNSLEGRCAPDAQDAGAADATLPVVPARPPSSGCSAAGNGTAGSFGSWWAIAVIALRRQRRSRSRSQRVHAEPFHRSTVPLLPTAHASFARMLQTDQSTSVVPDGGVDHAPARQCRVTPPEPTAQTSSGPLPATRSNGPAVVGAAVQAAPSQCCMGPW
jgi:hypothetical protein